MIESWLILDKSSWKWGSQKCQRTIIWKAASGILMLCSRSDYARQDWISHYVIFFQPQQHPARDAHDTFFISDPATTKHFPQKYLEKVKQIHSSGGFGSQVSSHCLLLLLSWYHLPTRVMDMTGRLKKPLKTCYAPTLQPCQPGCCTSWQTRREDSPHRNTSVLTEFSGMKHWVNLK